MHEEIKPGMIVARKSYGRDIYFKVEEVSLDTVVVKGLDFRLKADSPLSDLEIKTPEEVLAYKHQYIQKHLRFRRLILSSQRIFGWLSKFKKKAYLELPGRIVHLDGDEEYLEKCLDLYGRLGLEVQGFFVPEHEQPLAVQGYIREYMPDILILTGHDGLRKKKQYQANWSKLHNYRTSVYFVEAVKSARQVVPGKNDLVIAAGACQSYYEALLRAGANFASSPTRTFMHVYDIVYIAEKIAFTPASEMVTARDLEKQYFGEINTMGGIETRGCLRLGFPDLSSERSFSKNL